MVIFKKSVLPSLFLASCGMLAACDPLNLLSSPPSFAEPIHFYTIDNGKDVDFYFFTEILSGVSKMKCFDDNVPVYKLNIIEDNPPTLHNSFYTNWEAKASYTSHLPNKTGNNAITCTATNDNGSTTAITAYIEFIPNVPPDLIISQPISICGNDGTLTYNINLVDASSTYLTGAQYSLTQGTLPAGLSINTLTGKLAGKPAAGNFNPVDLKISATTAAGTDTSEAFSIQISSAACP